jgi:hypothetical protein
MCASLSERVNASASRYRREVRERVGVVGGGSFVILFVDVVCKCIEECCIPITLMLRSVGCPIQGVDLFK